jgi:peroxiredoxin
MTVIPALETNQLAPDFTLPDHKGDIHSLKDYHHRIAIVNFWSAECPWSRRTDQELVEYLENWGTQVALLPIASNVDESPELIAGEAAERGLSFVLLDNDHQIADLYGAITTPDLFVVDAQGILRYQGAFDDVTFRQRTPTQEYLRTAVESLLQDNFPEPSYTPSYGCTIVRHLP